MRWTPIGDAGPLPEARRLERFQAIVEVGKILGERGRSRGRGQDVHAWSSLTPEHRARTALIGELHELLFERFFGPDFGDQVERIGLVFAGFAAGAYDRRATEGTDGYRNGVPNGSVFIRLPELVGLLADAETAGDREGDFWTRLCPCLVAAIAVFGYSHYDGDPAQRTLGSYGIQDLGNWPRPDRDRLRELQREFQGFARGELDEHWRNLLQVIAPRNFGAATKPGFLRIQDYLAPA